MHLTQKNDKNLFSKYSENQLKVFKVLYFFSGIFLLIFGCLLALVSVALGIFIIGIGILSIYLSRKCKTNLDTNSYAKPAPKNPVNDKPVIIAKSDNNDLSYKTENHRVAGVTYDGRQEKIKKLGFKNDDYYLPKKDFIDTFSESENVYSLIFNPRKIELVEEPENPYDPNAIKVIIDGVHVGYIKAGSCSHIKKLLHANSILSIDADIGGGSYKYYIEYDGDYDRDSCEIFKESSNYHITLRIKTKA